MCGSFPTCTNCFVSETHQLLPGSSALSCPPPGHRDIRYALWTQGCELWCKKLPLGASSCKPHPPTQCQPKALLLSGGEGCLALAASLLALGPCAGHSLRVPVGRSRELCGDLVGWWLGAHDGLEAAGPGPGA